MTGHGADASTCTYEMDMTKATFDKHGRWKLAVILLFLGAFFALRWIASLPQTPGIEPTIFENREPFVVDFALPTLQGATIRLSDLHGRVVLLNLWATWCYPCRSEMPAMNDLYRDYHGQGLEILAVASDAQGAKVVAPFVQEYALLFPVLLDPHNSLATRLHIQGIPTSYLLDKNGRIVGMEIGARDWNGTKVRRLIDTLLAEEVSSLTP